MSEKPTYEELEQKVLELEKANSKRKQAEEKIQRDESRLRRLVDILQHSSETIQDFLDYALDQAIKLTESKIGYIYHYNEDRKEFVLNTWSRDVMAECAIANPSTCYELDKTGIWGEAVRQRRPIILNDFQNTNPLKSGYPKGHVQLYKFITVPIFKDGSIVSVVGLANKESNYDESDIFQVSLLLEAVWKVIDRKQTEEALRLRESYLRAIIENQPGLFWLKDEQSRFLIVNEAFAISCGKQNPDMILGKTDFDIWPNELAQKYRNDDIVVMKSAKSRTVEEPIFDRGVTKWFETFKNPIFDEQGSVIGTTGYAHDITERKLAEQDRALNSQRTQVLLQLNQMTEATLQEVTDFALEEAIRLTNSTIGYLAFLNDDESILTMHSWSKSAMAECTIADKAIKYPVESTGLWGEAVRQRRPVITNDYSATGPMVKGYPDGHVAVRRHMNTPVFAGSRIVLLAGVGNKVEEYDQDDVQQLTLLMEGMWRLIERKRTEEALQKGENKYRLIAENTADLISILDMNLRFTYVSPASMRLRGFTAEEAIGQTLKRVLTPESMRLALAVFEKEILLEDSGTADPKRMRILELEIYKKDGSVVWVEVNFSFLRDKDRKPVEILTVSRDITERKRAEEEKAKLEAQLQQAQKSEAIGTLAGGIAHDFNNLLMGIQGRASLLSFDLEPSHPHLEHIHAIEEYIRSATSLTKQLLGFARGGKYEVNPVDMNELVHGTSAMFGRTKKEIYIHTKCHASPLVVEADRGQIEQVLLNMYINAWQAMPPDGGHLYLETKIVALDETYCKSHQAEPGRFVKVSITDTGSGMDEATRLRIFDPFFTTKGMGRGTGLGLASAFGIIKNHGGMITVYSEVGHGTTFNIYLPLSNKEAHREVPLEERLIKGSATILLVDDEEMITEVGQAMLERLGYSVMVCQDGQEAVKMITDMGNEIDMVILDMIMPGMDGGTTFDHIREIQPDMPVLLSSGYAINGHADKIMRRGCNGFIQKPYNFSELSQKIGKVLDAAK